MPSKITIVNITLCKCKFMTNIMIYYTKYNSLPNENFITPKEISFVSGNQPGENCSIPHLPTELNVCQNIYF